MSGITLIEQLKDEETEAREVNIPAKQVTCHAVDKTGIGKNPGFLVPKPPSL
jgi:hypothetical protein